MTDDSAMGRVARDNAPIPGPTPSQRAAWLREIDARATSDDEREMFAGMILGVVA